MTTSKLSAVYTAIADLPAPGLAGLGYGAPESLLEPPALRFAAPGAAFPFAFEVRAVNGVVRVEFDAADVDGSTLPLRALDDTGLRGGLVYEPTDAPGYVAADLARSLSELETAYFEALRALEARNAPKAVRKAASPGRFEEGPVYVDASGRVIAYGNAARLEDALSRGRVLFSLPSDTPAERLLALPELKARLSEVEGDGVTALDYILGLFDLGSVVTPPLARAIVREFPEARFSGEDD